MASNKIKLLATGLTLASVALLGTACQGGGRPADKGALTTVTYRGPFVTTGGDAPFYLAKKLGYYAEEGIDLEIRDSKGSSQTIADVDSGGSDIGMASATNVMLAVSQGQQIVAVATPLGKSSFGFFVPKESGITSISGLSGKSIAVTALVAPNMHAALATSGLSKESVTPVFADATALPTTYLGGKVDALYTAGYLRAALQRRPSDLLLQADAGFNPPDYALIVKPKMLIERRDLVERFVRATLLGYQAAKQDPAAAVEALREAHPEITAESAAGVLASTFDFYCSQDQKGSLYGENSYTDWSNAAEALRAFADLKGQADGSRFFTNELFRNPIPVSITIC